MLVTEHMLEEAKKAPRVTLAYLESQIVDEFYFSAAQGALAALIDSEMEAAKAAIPKLAVHNDSLGLLTFCVLLLKNGFSVTGESACASPENFNPAIGRELAKQQAIGKVWPLLGYELKTKVALVAEATKPSKPEQITYVGTKVVHAMPMSRLAYNQLRGWTLPADERGEDEGFLVEYGDGGRGNVPDFMGYVSWSPKDVFEQAYKAFV